MSLKADKALELVEKIKEAKLRLAKSDYHERDSTQYDLDMAKLRDAEEDYQNYLYSQRP